MTLIIVISSVKVFLSWLIKSVLMADQDIQNFVMHSVLSFIGSNEVRYANADSLYHLFLICFSIRCFILLIFIIYLASPNSYVLHQELLNFMLVTMSTQLLSGPSHGPTDANPFIDAAMTQVTKLITFFFVFSIDITSYQFPPFPLVQRFSGKVSSFSSSQKVAT